MKRLAELQEKNSFKLYLVSDPEFKKYGQILMDIDFDNISQYMDLNTAIPEQGNCYVANDEKLKAIPEMEDIQFEIFGGMKIQAGYCNGHSHILNAMEWHACAEVSYAETDLILFLGRTEDLEDLSDEKRFHSKNAMSFFVPKGTGFQLYAETLHFAPVAVSDEGFKCLVILEDGTNSEIQKEYMKNDLFKKNKWMIAHKDRADLIANGVREGIDGDNLYLIY
jgi:hypothetical protein